MVMKYVNLPLYSDPDYIYNVPLENVAYRIRMYFNIRVQCWVMDIYYSDNTPVVVGVKITPNFPILDGIPLPLSGFFWLESVPKEINEVVDDPYEIWKYYRFYYCYED